MVHPDYQYTPKLVPAMATMLAFDEYDACIASRFIGKGALEGGMPLYKFIANKCLTLFQNLMMGERLHRIPSLGFRAFTREVLEKWPLKDATTILFLQRNACTHFLQRLHNRPDKLPHKILPRCVFNQLYEKLQIRLRGFKNKYFVCTRKMGYL